LGLSVRTYKVATAAVRGSSHVERGEPCQDFAAAKRTKSMLAIALADGAGSARHADIGARVTVSSTLAILRREFEVLSDAGVAMARDRVVSALRQRLTGFSRQRSVHLRDLSATLLFAATNGSSFVCGQLGDGRIASFDRNLSMAQTMFPPTKGEFLNETIFVTSENAPEAFQWRTGAFEDIGGFALMSDGAEESLFNRHEKRFAPALTRMAGWLVSHSEMTAKQALERNLEGALRVHTDDDVSLAFMCRASESDPPDHNGSRSDARLLR